MPRKTVATRLCPLVADWVAAAQFLPHGDAVDRGARWAAGRQACSVDWAAAAVAPHTTRPP